MPVMVELVPPRSTLADRASINGTIPPLCYPSQQMDWNPDRMIRPLSRAGNDRQAQAISSRHDFYTNERALRARGLSTVTSGKSIQIVIGWHFAGNLRLQRATLGYIRA